MKKLLLLIALSASLYLFFKKDPPPTAVLPKSPAQNTVPQPVNKIAHAYQHKKSNVQVRGTGTVIRLLKDDNEGSRHQKFILRLPSNQTLLIAHNIDLAPRINSITTGDVIEFFGEYEWNSKGGVVHWTHKDSKGDHVAGWLKHEGRIYQ